MERKIGETFEYEGKKIEVRAAIHGCDGCFYKGKCRINSAVSLGSCAAGDRTDKKHVVFVEVQKQPHVQAEQPKELNLCEILKNCPEGTELWSDNYGLVKFVNVSTEWDTPIRVELINGFIARYTEEGWCDKRFPANCLLWPSRDCRDWSKFTAPWLKKERFDPKTLKAFDRVLVKDSESLTWKINLFSHINNKAEYPYCCLLSFYKYCIPYNDETKHLVGTKDEAPDFYKYWED